MDDERLRRALRFAALPGNTLAAAAARFDLPVSALRRARTRLGRPTLSRDDLLLHALERPARPADLVGWLDYVDHALYSPAEIEGMLRRLAEAGRARETAEGWVRDGEWP